MQFVEYIENHIQVNYMYAWLSVSLVLWPLEIDGIFFQPSRTKIDWCLVSMTSADRKGQERNLPIISWKSHKWDKDSLLPLGFTAKGSENSTHVPVRERIDLAQLYQVL